VDGAEDMHKDVDVDEGTGHQRLALLLAQEIADMADGACVRAR